MRCHDGASRNAIIPRRCRRNLRKFLAWCVTVPCLHVCVLQKASTLLLPDAPPSSSAAAVIISSDDVRRHDANNFNNPLRPIVANYAGAGNATDIRIRLPDPLLGRHDGSSDAVFAFAYGYDPPAILRFVQSLLDTGYDGDIVLGIDYDRLMASLEKGGRADFEAGAFGRYLDRLSKRHKLVLHDLKFECTTDEQLDEVCTTPYLYRVLRDQDDGAATAGEEGAEFLSDPRPARHATQFRNEYYWAWSHYYLGDGSSSTASRILLSDLRDVYFQGNPFGGSPFSSSGGRQQTTLQVFEEDAHSDILSSPSNAIWIRMARGESVLKEIGHNPILCAGTTLGGAVAIEAYLRALIEEFDATRHTLRGVDQGLHNVLLYSGKLFIGAKDEGASTLTISNMTDPVGRLALRIVKREAESTKMSSKKGHRIEQVEYVSQGFGLVNTLGVFCTDAADDLGGRPLEKLGLLKERKNEQEEGDNIPVVLNWDGKMSPVIHQFDRCTELSPRLEKLAYKLWDSVSLSY